MIAAPVYIEHLKFGFLVRDKTIMELLFDDIINLFLYVIKSLNVQSEILVNKQLDVRIMQIYLMI